MGQNHIGGKSSILEKSKCWKGECLGVRMHYFQAQDIEFVLALEGPSFEIRLSIYFLKRCNDKDAAKQSRQHRRSSSTEGHLPTKVIFHWRLSSTVGRVPLKIVFHRRLSSTEGHIPTKIIFHWRSSSTEGHLPPKVVFHWRLSATEGCLPPKVKFQQRLSSAEGHLPPKVVFN